MTVGQKRVWETNWAELGRRLEEMPPGAVDLAAWFGREAPTVLEIGTGMGDATAQLAVAAPEVNHLAAEVYPAGLGQLMLWVEKYELDNVRLLQGDALDFLRDHVAPDTLAGVRIYFPDPWPKKRHHKRRLVTAPFVALVASRLRPAERCTGNGLGGLRGSDAGDLRGRTAADQPVRRLGPATRVASGHQVRVTRPGRGSRCAATCIFTRVTPTGW